MLPAPDPLTRLDSDHEARALDAIIDAGHVRTVFQPMSWLTDGHAAGVEALSRGPSDHSLESPDALFAAARRTGRVGELDRLCLRTTLTAAQQRGLAGHVPVFVNVEAMTFTPEAVREVAAMRDGLAPRARVVLEITEGSIRRNPSVVLAASREARRFGLGISLDDIGAEPTSLALLPLLRPDVVKLDRQLMRGRDRTRIAAVASAVGAYAEATGSVVVVEGVETPDDRGWAVAIGAHVAQGWLCGRPRELVDLSIPVTPVSLMRESAPEPGQTPFCLVEQQGDLRVARKRELLSMSRDLERVAAHWHADAATVAASVQCEANFTPATARRFEDLARRSPLVTVFGAGMPSAPAPGVLGIPLDLDDPLREEWNVVVLGPHHAAALLARDLGDAGADTDRRFSFVLTHRRDLVVHATRTLLARATAP